MNNNHNTYSLRKKIVKKNKENKKEEEDVNSENQCSMEVIPMKYNENLDFIVIGMKINGSEVESFQDYQKKIKKIIKLYEPSIKEYDYRIKNEAKKDDQVMSIDINANTCQNSSNSLLEKMKKIGKIGVEPTILDKESSNEELELKQGGLKLTANGSFTSVRANNCVFKGKWCYEVVLITGKLNQIGWCQINTPFKTRDGVGDDITSYAYDGYRIVKWHDSKEKYGELWDIGDVIGVCIDLEEKNIQYFQNGKNLGIAYDNIPTGPNLAYFPAISLSRDEKVVFNFGGLDMTYKYPGFEPFDIPESVYKNSQVISSNLIEITKTYILKMINLKEINKASKLAISSCIFNFLANVSFRELFIFGKLVLPFLIELSQSNKDELKTFLENILVYVDHKSEFIASLFENICNMIELYSTRRFEGINQREQLIKLTIKLIQIDFITQLWVESRKYIEHLKLIFSGNYLKVIEISNYVIENLKSGKYTQENGKTVYKEIRRECEQKIWVEGMNIYEEKLNSSLCELIQTFIFDKRTFRANNKEHTLRTILLEYYTKNIRENSYQPGIMLRISTMNENFIKYFYFNLLDLFSENFNKDLSLFSTEPWFSRSKSDSFYYDEVGIGGTISHVTTEYGSKIDDIFKTKTQETMVNYTFHRILHITSSYIIPVIKQHLITYEEVPKINELISDNTKSSFLLHKFFRSYYNIFTIKNQTLIYQMSFFIINWLTTITKRNKDLLYFIPKSIMELPYDLFRLLLTIKSSLIKNTEIKEKANLKCSYFVNDNYIYLILNFYLSLFNDPNIANPELKEGFMEKISYFINRRNLLHYFEQHEDLLEMLIKGILRNMTNESMCKLASENMVKIIEPICFGEKKEKSAKGKITLIRVVKKLFETNTELFQEFMDNYYKLLNKVMTEYSFSLREASSQLLSNTNVNNLDFMDRLSNHFKRVVLTLSFFCGLMKILEFLLAAYSKEFFDINTINFSRLSNFLKNLSSRILEKNYYDNLYNLIEKFKSKKCQSYHTSLTYSVIGIFLNINENKQQSTFNDFINKLVLQSDFDIEPFYNVLIYIKKDEVMEKDLEIFKKFIDYLASMKSTKVAKKMSEQEWEETVKKENICIICYVNDSNRILIPCKHVCCHICLMQYLTEKKHCFICNTLIEKTEQILN